MSHAVPPRGQELRVPFRFEPRAEEAHAGGQTSDSDLRAVPHSSTGSLPVLDKDKAGDQRVCPRLSAPSGLLSSSRLMDPCTWSQSTETYTSDTDAYSVSDSESSASEPELNSSSEGETLRWALLARGHATERHTAQQV